MTRSLMHPRVRSSSRLIALCAGSAAIAQRVQRLRTGDVDTIRRGERQGLRTGRRGRRRARAASSATRSAAGPAGRSRPSPARRAARTSGTPSRKTRTRRPTGSSRSGWTAAIRVAFHYSNQPTRARRRAREARRRRQAPGARRQLGLTRAATPCYQRRGLRPAVRRVRALSPPARPPLAFAGAAGRRLALRDSVPVQRAPGWAPPDASPRAPQGLRFPVAWA